MDPPVGNLNPLPPPKLKFSPLEVPAVFVTDCVDVGFCSSLNRPPVCKGADGFCVVICCKFEA